MVSDPLLGLIALCYYLGFLLLCGLALFIAWKGRGRAHARLRRSFLLLALSLLLWQLTLFSEARTTRMSWQLGLGRLNFTVIVFAVYLTLRFVQEIPAKGARKRSFGALCLLAETWLLALFTLLTPLVDAAERVESGHAVTTFGGLFPFYLLHVVGYLMTALSLSLWLRQRVKERMIRSQLTLIGLGILTTGSIALVTNALLPYGYGDFRFCDVGSLSTIGFVLAVAYATFLRRLFGIRVLLRETLVYGLLLTFVLGTYSSSVFLVTQYLTSSAGKLTQATVLLIAFSFDPLRRFLEKKTDRLLFARRQTHRRRKKGHNQERDRPAAQD